MESATGRRGLAHIHPEAVLPNAGAALRHQGDTAGLARAKAPEDCGPLTMDLVGWLFLLVVASFQWGRLVGHNAGYHEAVGELQRVFDPEVFDPTLEDEEKS